AFAGPPEDRQVRGSYFPQISLSPHTTNVPMQGRLAFLPAGSASKAPAIPLVSSPEQATGYSVMQPPPGSPVWVAFVIHDDSSRDDWCLSMYSLPGGIRELIIQSDTGALRSWTGQSLKPLYQKAGMPNVTVLRLPDPGSARWTVYALFGSGYYPDSDLRLWRTDLLASRLDTIQMMFGLNLGMFTMLVLAAYASWMRDRFSDLVLAMPSSSIAFFILVASFRGGGFTSLVHEGIGPRSLHNALVLALGLYGVYRSHLFSPVKQKFTLKNAIMVFAYPAMLGLSLLFNAKNGAIFSYLVLCISSVFVVGRGMRCVAQRDYYNGATRLAAMPQTAAAVLGFASIASSWQAATLGQAILLPMLMSASTASALCIVAVNSALVSRKNRLDLQEAHAALRKSVESRQSFLSRMTSSIRSPLHSIMEMLDVKPDLGNPHSLPLDQAELARAECARVLGLVESMHSFARSESDDKSRVSEAFNLAQLVEAAVRSSRYLGSGKISSWEIQVPIIEMRNDPLALQSLVATIIQRSLRTVAASAISARASSDMHLVRMEISDNGEKPSLNDEALSMELEMAKELAKKLGGNLEYLRHNGANVYNFDFPRSMSWQTEPDAKSTKPPIQMHAPGQYEAAHETELDLAPTKSATAIGSVLIVDDKPLSLFTLKRKLEQAGWTVDAQVSARVALKKLADGQKPDLVIADAIMQELSGHDFCRGIRLFYRREDLPVILILDSNWPEEIEEAFHSGASDYLLRPATGPELLARVQTHADLAAGIQRELEHRDHLAEVDKFKTLGWLTAGVAHEINTPNNASLRNIPMLREIWHELEGSVDRLADTTPDYTIRGFTIQDLKHEIPEMLGDLYMGAQHIKKIVEDLKDYARGPGVAPDHNVDVNLVAEYACRLLKHAIAVSTKRFSVELAQKLPPVRVDRLKLTQVVVNVLENALQALPDSDGAVQLSSGSEIASDGRQWVLIRIRDEGLGMDSRTLANVFDPFFTTKRERGGTGLGLPVASGIIREAGGSIQISSSAGAGATVMIRLPAAGEGDAR
ncbi:MAG TPA: ATP-binding protein, partial [Spirochaetales bacterium]|nr:ATP-binding protein [Spirochaetales bacterium]